MKAIRAIYKSDLYRWANSLPGKPVIHVEGKGSSFTIYHHRQTRRVVHYKNLIGLIPPGTVIYFELVSHKKLKAFKTIVEINYSPRYPYNTGYIAGDYYKGAWDWD